MRRGVDQAVGRHDAELAGTAGPVVQVVLAGVDVDTLDAAPGGQQESLGRLSAVAAVVVPHVERVACGKPPLLVSALEIETQKRVFHRGLNLRTGTPADQGHVEMLVDPDPSVDYEYVGLRVVNPTAILALPEELAVDGAECPERAGYGVKADPAFGLGEEHHVVGVDQHA